jgi:YceI-like domain
MRKMARARRSLAVAAGCALLASGIALADPVPAGGRGRCAIRFTATSTLHDVAGGAPPVPIAAERHRDAATGLVWWSATIEVPVASMETGNARRDRSMHALLDAERFPRIRADFAQVRPDELRRAAQSDGRQGGGLPFALTIRDVTRPVDPALTAWVEDERHVAFDADFAISLRAFGLEAPAVLGLVRVADRVAVHVHVTLDKPPDAADAGGAPRPSAVPTP